MKHCLFIFSQPPKKESTVQHLHFTGWSNPDSCPDPQEILDLLTAVQQSQQQTGNGVIVFQCRWIMEFWFAHKLYTNQTVLKEWMHEVFAGVFQRHLKGLRILLVQFNLKLSGLSRGIARNFQTGGHTFAKTRSFSRFSCRFNHLLRIVCLKHGLQQGWTLNFESTRHSGEWP